MNASNPDRHLLIAVGNSGRRDDGLGWAFADAVKASGRFGGDVEYRYQLQVEDAELISRYDQVIVVDAYKGEAGAPFFWQRCPEENTFHFTTHALDPGSVLSLCRQVYDRSPEVWLLGIKGEEWGLGEGLSEEGRGNLGWVLGSGFWVLGGGGQE